MRQTAKWCGIPALSSPFRHRRTRDYHPSASHGAPTLSGHVLTLWIVRPAAESWSDRASFPGKTGAKRPWRTVCYVQLDVMRNAGTRRVPPVASTSSHAFGSQIWPFRHQIWTEGVLVEHPAPVVGRCNPGLFRSKTDWTLLVLLACSRPKWDNPGLPEKRFPPWTKGPVAALM